jgi:hypothetical protein
MMRSVHEQIIIPLRLLLHVLEAVIEGRLVLVVKLDR